MRRCGGVVWVVLLAVLGLMFLPGTSPVSAAPAAISHASSQDDGYICNSGLCVQSFGNLAYLRPEPQYGSTTDWICIYAAKGCQFEQSGTSLVWGWNNADAGFILEAKVTPAPTWQEFYNLPSGSGFKIENVYLAAWLYNEGLGNPLGLTTQALATVWTASKLGAAASTPPPPPPPAGIGQAPPPGALPDGACGTPGSGSSCMPATDLGPLAKSLTGADLVSGPNAWDQSQTFLDNCNTDARHACSQGSIKTDAYGNALLTSSGTPGNNAQLSSETLGGQGFSQTYGIVEAELYVPAGPDGIADWSSFWRTGTGWPNGGEQDIYEGLGCDESHYWYQTSPTTAAPLSLQGADGNGCQAMRTPGWHDITGVWEQDYYAVYVDGVLTAWQYSSLVSGAAPLMVVFDNATGNAAQNNGVIGKAATQSTLGVGWFRAWEWSGV